MGDFWGKFKSRKFIVCVAGVLTGVSLIIMGNTVEGAASVIASVLGYIAAEGYIDGKAVKNTIEITQDVLEETKKNLEEFESAGRSEDDGNGA